MYSAPDNRYKELRALCVNYKIGTNIPNLVTVNIIQ